MQGPRTGVWLIGARGAVATTAQVGAAALALEGRPPTGLVTELPEIRSALLPPLDTLVFGGSDVVETPLVKRANGLVHSGVIPESAFRLTEEALTANEGNVRPGVREGEPAMAAVERVKQDLAEFKASHDLGRIVVVNVSTTEPVPPAQNMAGDLQSLRDALDHDSAQIPVSSLYAYAALEAGCAFVDFTPSTGARHPGLEELARARGVPHAGRDGKTGETLVRSALAPLFASRNLDVRSWAGANLLGGGDGAALAEAARQESKLRSKQLCVPQILGHKPESALTIGYVAELNEWKTAWDHVLFEGFLGTRMRLQLIWEGCDPALAAPLVLDLARLMAAAHAAGVAGGVPELAFFFKDPLGTTEHRLERQFDLLSAWVARLGPLDSPGTL